MKPTFFALASVVLLAACNKDKNTAPNGIRLKRQTDLGNDNSIKNVREYHCDAQDRIAAMLGSTAVYYQYGTNYAIATYKDSTGHAKYHLNAAGFADSVEVYNGVGNNARLVSAQKRSYDQLGQVTAEKSYSITGPSGTLQLQGTTFYEYQAGNCISKEMVNRLGDLVNRLTYEYDDTAINRLSGEYCGWTYDGASDANLRTKILDPYSAPITYTYHYNSQGLVDTCWSRHGNNPLPFNKTAYEYW